MRRSGPVALVWKAVRKWLNVGVLPFVPFNNVRVAGYRLVGFKIGRDVFIGMQCYLDDMYPERLVIEDDVVVSYRVTVACHGPRSRDHRLVLRKGSYIGTGATLLGGRPNGDVEIGPYATVGACALVTKSIPSLSTAVGVPARITRTGRPPWESDDDRADELRQIYLQDPVAVPIIEPSIGPTPGTLRVVMRCEQSGVFIRFTLDGDEPTEEAPIYDGPLLVDRSAVLRARSFKPGYLPSSGVCIELEVDA